MPNKYYNTIDKIKNDEEFKKSLIEKLKIEAETLTDNNVKVSPILILKNKINKT